VKKLVPAKALSTSNLAGAIVKLALRRKLTWQYREGTPRTVADACVETRAITIKQTRQLSANKANLSAYAELLELDSELLELDKMKRSHCILLVLLATPIPISDVLAQGTHDPSTPPQPYVVQQGPLPPNTMPPTPNRVQGNIFSPGAPMPRLRPIYRRGSNRF
jgi:hypothetical protein